MRCIQVLFSALVFTLVCLVVGAHARENKTQFSSTLPPLYFFREVVLNGSYYSIGTFLKIKNAYDLKSRSSKFKPLVLLVRKKNKSYYRVIVGPITNKNKQRIRGSLIKSNFADVWLIRANGSSKVVFKKTEANQLKAIKLKPKIKKKTNISLGLKTDKVALEKTSDISESYFGDSLKDCKVCPEQVILPAGRFVMGEANGGISEDANAIGVTIPKPFSISRFEITFALWDACLADGGCSGYRPPDEGWGRGTRPVVNVNRADILSYTSWLSKKTSRLYRLPSEAEWEYAARAGTTTEYWWGDSVGINKAVCQDCGSIYDGEKTAQVGSFGKNKFGIFDTSGNVWEWVEDCYNKTAYQSYRMYPKPFYRSKISHKNDDCRRVLRGGGSNVASQGVMSSFRFISMPQVRSKFYGFRLVREID
jgi:formylglycine-generating enzyme required for sulfatase activity